jgi:hypothetical protein
VKLTVELCSACFERESALHAAGRPGLFVHPHPLSEFIPIAVELGAVLSARATTVAASVDGDVPPLGIGATAGSAAAPIASAALPVHRPIPSPRAPSIAAIEPPKQPLPAPLATAPAAAADVPMAPSGPTADFTIGGAGASQALRPGSAFTIPNLQQSRSTTPQTTSAALASAVSPPALLVGGAMTDAGAGPGLAGERAQPVAASWVVAHAAATRPPDADATMAGSQGAAAAVASSAASSADAPTPTTVTESIGGSVIGALANVTLATYADARGAQSVGPAASQDHSADGVLADPDEPMHSPFFITRQVGG